MAILKSTAIPIRISDYSETSVIADFFTRSYGLVRAICKGAHRKVKAYESSIDLLALGEISYYERSSGLNILKQFSACLEFQSLRKDINRYKAALACLDFVRQATVENQPAQGLFDLFSDALGACARGTEPWSGVYAFILTGLKESGFAPSLEECASCGSNSLPHGAKARTACSFAEGGVLCMKCGQGQKVEMWLTSEALEVLKQLDGMKPREAAEKAPKPAIARAVGAFLKRYCEFTFERPFRMIKY
jgi:DNA repair protein RecO (recombination protein O)